MKWRGQTFEGESFYLLGLIAADGYVAKEGGSNQSKVSINCGNSAGDQKFAKYVARLIDSTWGQRFGFSCTLRHVDRRPPRVPYWEPHCCSRSLAGAIRKFCEGRIGTYSWRIPPALLRSPGPELLSWIQGFADGDGTVSVKPPKREVRISSVNREGIEDIRRALSHFSISAKVYEHDREIENWEPSINIVICDRRSLEIYAQKIGFRQPDKKRKLAEALASYKRDHANLLRHEVEDLLPEVIRRRACGESFAEIQEALELATVEVPKGMLKRAVRSARGKCVVCLKSPATHSIPRVVRGRSGKYACDPCLIELEPKEEWGEEFVQLKLREVADFLDENHYLGRRSSRNAFALRNKHGVLVFSRKPQASSLPRDWLELSRWCIVSDDMNAGTKQWSRAKAWLRENTEATTVVTYSDPSRHDGSLYRAAGFLWAPSSQFLLKNLSLTGERHPGKPYVDKNRWVYPLRPDARRAEALTVRHPWLYNSDELKFLCDWPEPKWRGRGTRFSGGGKDYQRWKELLQERSNS